MSLMRARILPRQGALSLSEIAVLALCLVLAATVRDRHYADIMIQTFLWAGLALSWNIAGGYTGLISFGHAAFFGLSAYASTLLLVRFGVSPWIGMWIGAAIAGFFGGCLALICARLRGPFFILSTLAAGEVVRIGALNWRGLTGGSEGLEIPPVFDLASMVFASQFPYLALVLVYFVGMFLLSKQIERSRFGFYLFATRDDEDGASAVGIDPLWMRVKAMGLSAFATGLGGSLFAQYFLYLDPTHVISPELSFQFALICAIGGLGTAVGPVIGAFIVIPLSEILRSTLGGAASGLHLAIYGATLIVVILYFPGGVAGTLTRLGGTRRRIGVPSAVSTGSSEP
jgi:branched-chain amino acid transport system permease protein